MASGTPCLNSRWDQPKPKADMLQGILGNVSHTHSPHTSSAPANSVVGRVGMQFSASGPPGSVVPATPGNDSPQGGVEMAAAMAAKINAMLMAKGKLKPLQPLPSKVPSSVPQPVSSEEIVVTEVDINDVPVNCRNLLTKGKTQEEIRLYSGAVVSTKGLYMSDADKSSSTGMERPLYLHVQGRTQDEVNKAVMRIKEIISEDILRASGGQQPAVMPTVPIYPQPPRPVAPAQPLRPHLPANARLPNAPVTPAHRPPPPHSGSFVHTKIFVGLDQSLPSFNVNEKVEGPNGTYLQHIQTETGARVFLRGKGSGYIEQASRRESFEPLYLYISHPNAPGLEAAKKLCESLLETVRAEHARMLSVYTATGSAQAYPAHGYSSSSSSSSYSSQSWYGYPTNGYASAYPSYPAAGGYWNKASGPSGQTSANTQTPGPTQGMVQYPVCPRQSSTFLLQDESGSSGSAVNTSFSPPDSRSPKRRFIEDGEEEKEQTENKPDSVRENECSPEGGSKSDGVLMPPPSIPLLPAVRKRPRETEQPALSHTGWGKEEEDDDDDEEDVKKPKVSTDLSGLVPYGGDSSDEEEENRRKNSA
ncbi:KH homology domain-containing protein 4-like [Salminus brasiliensis]|uniref:KH homology domain-containing protein 4-like n=1 Tax=Salminus brasiliensis TaxID=930266 RepID=UPI003B835E83